MQWITDRMGWENLSRNSGSRFESKRRVWEEFSDQIPSLIIWYSFTIPSEPRLAVHAERGWGEWKRRKKYADDPFDEIHEQNDDRPFDPFLCCLQSANCLRLPWIPMFLFTLYLLILSLLSLLYFTPWFSSRPFDMFISLIHWYFSFILFPSQWMASHT